MRSKLDRPRAAWTWFIEGLVEALLRAKDRAGRAAPFRLDLSGQGATVADARGLPIGTLADQDGTAVLEPPDLARRLSGAALDIVIPDGWMQRRDLEPVALASRPFLDAFVRHHIERITPWRVGDTHYRVMERPLEGDPGRLAVAVAVVPRRLVARPLAALQPLHLRALRLRCAGDAAGATAIAIGGDRPRLVAALRKGVLRGLAAAVLLFAVTLGTLAWQSGLVHADIDEQDRVLAERKAVLARARRGTDPGGEAAAKLRALRDARSPAMATLDALSAALPDSAHLTALAIEGDRVTVTGVTTEPSGLVPALETAGAFADVAFGAATTPTEGGAGDRFSLEMRVLPPRSDHAVGPVAASQDAAGGAP